MGKTFYILCIVFFLVNLTLAFIPYWTRKTENFGVSIPEHLYNRKDFNQMRKKYVIILSSINFLLFGLLIFSSFYVSENTVMMLFTAVMILFLLASFIVYLPYHSKMKKIKEKENWHIDYKQTIVIDPKFRSEKLTYSNGWFLIPLAITILTIGYSFFVFDQIPNQVPIHTSITGEVTYAEKSIGNLLLLPFSQIFMLLVFFIINFIIKQSKQQISATNPEASKIQNIIFRRRWSLYMIISSIMMTLLFSYVQLTMIYPSLLPYQDVVFFISIVIILLGTIILSISTGQGGSRVKVTNAKNGAEIDRDDDRYWKLGQFYFNKDDPAIFIEKRFGIGWTNNWAHPISWILVIGILAIAILFPFLLSKL